MRRWMAVWVYRFYESTRNVLFSCAAKDRVVDSETSQRIDDTEVAESCRCGAVTGTPASKRWKGLRLALLHRNILGSSLNMFSHCPSLRKAKYSQFA